MNHAAVAPLPLSCVEAQTAANEAWATDGSLAYDSYEHHAEQVRARAGALLGVDPSMVAFVKNTTEGLSFVARGLDWSPGDRILIPGREFPSTIYPFQSLEPDGVTVDLLDPVGPGETLPLEVFQAELSRAPTRLVVCSWVQYRRGWKVDLAALAALCHEHGALLCADVIQGLGVLPADLSSWGVDFAAADSHKWMLGPQGIGVLYVAPSHLDRLRAVEVGWNSVPHRDDYDHLELLLDPSARRFEGGTQNLTSIAGLGASVDLLLSAGVEAIWNHVDGLCDQAAEVATAAGATVVSDRGEGRSGIVTVVVPDRDPKALCRELQRQGIVVAPRGDGLRISPHGYNTASEVERFGAALNSALGRRGSGA